METSDFKGGLSRRVINNIRFNARRLGRQHAIPGMQADDYEQDLVADLLHRSRSFDPARSSFMTFADRIVRHRICALLRPSLRLTTERQTVSLDGHWEDDAVAMAIELMPDGQSPIDDDAAIRIDVQRFVRELPPRLLQCCAIHLGASLSEEASAAGIHRSTVYERTGRLRERAIEFGLDVYFPGGSDTSAAASVCGGEGGSAALSEPRTMLQQSSRMRAQLLVTLEDFYAWIAEAAAGDQLELFRGFLAVDRIPAGSRLPAEHARELNRIARAALSLSDDRRLHLVQRRLGPSEYSYICIARPPQQAEQAREAAR